MPLQDIVNVNISLETAAVSQAGFGTPLFISDDQRFLERVRGYTSLSAVSEDFEATDAAYIAASQAFAQTPSPSVVKIGRKGSTDASLTPVGTIEGSTFSVTVTVNDGDSIVATYIGQVADDAEAVVTDLAADINGDVDVSAHVTASVNGTGASATLEISGNTGTDVYSLSSEDNLTIAYTSTEAAGDALAAIQAEDDDFYFVAASDHSEAFVLAMAAAVEANSKLYFVSVADAGSYATLADPATDILGKLKEFAYFRTSGWYHQAADTQFPEMAFISTVATATPGTKVWGNTRVGGVTPSANADTGTSLSYTERNNLNERNANWVVNVAGNNIQRTGKVAANEWIDVVRDRDFWEARLTEAFQQKFIAAPKIPYTDSGINELRSVFRSVSNQLVTTPTQPNVLQEVNPYTSNFPKAADVPVVDKQNRILRATFTGFLAGAIQIAELQGTLTYEQPTV